MTAFHRLLRILLAAACCSAALAHAQKFPDHPIRLIIPYAPGGGTDNLIRSIAPQLGTALGQQLIVDNRPGGSSMIGTDAVVRSAPDGYTLMATDLAVLVNPGLFKARVPFDTVKSLQGVTMMAYAPVVLVVHPSVPARNLAELLALARSKPGTLNYASGGNGASTHLSGELMKQAAKVDIVHIPYKGTGPAMNDLLAGQVHMQFAGISSVRQHVATGKLRAIAVTGKQRNAAMPDVPTFAESGLDVPADTYWGVYAPAGVPQDVVDTVNRAFVSVLRDPANAEKLAAGGFLPIANSPAEHTRQLKAMVESWTDVIDKAKIQVD